MLPVLTRNRVAARAVIPRNRSGPTQHMKTKIADFERLCALSNLFDLKQRTALVTGASRGLGRAISLSLAAAGANVAVNYRARREDAAEVVKEIEGMGGRAIAIQGDVAVMDQVRTIVDGVTSELGSPDILVANAGVARPFAFDKVSAALWDETMSVNLRSAFLLASAAIPAMRQRRWGRVIFVSSDAASLGGIVGPHYAASKAGLIGLMHSYASNLAQDGVTVNAVSPALIETDMIRGNARAKPSALPVARFGRPQEVALAVLMLACNGFITGQTIHVNGGLYPT
jgi:3-oxoacyl-[acyl-carrier protein] reductase